MTFDEWWAAQLATPGQRSTQDLARKAWEAATVEAARKAEATTARYTCNKMRGVCNAIAHQIRQGKEETK